MRAPALIKEKEVSGIKNLVGKRITKKIKFMGEDVEIAKLTVAEVREITEAVRGMEGKEDSEEGLTMVKKIVKQSVTGASELEDADFDTFPMDELSKLSSEIMAFSGMGGEKGK